MNKIPRWEVVRMRRNLYLVVKLLAIENNIPVSKEVEGLVKRGMIADGLVEKLSDRR